MSKAARCSKFIFYKRLLDPYYHQMTICKCRKIKQYKRLLIVPCVVCSADKVTGFSKMLMQVFEEFFGTASISKGIAQCTIVLQ